jgi:predicted CopG family antitoxin
MSQRINISVPDELYQKLQTFKERLSMSKICQEALGRAIRIEEMRSQVDEDIERLARVWAEERREGNREFFEEGFKDGMHDAFQMDYEGMCHLAVIQDDPTEEVFERCASTAASEKVENSTFAAAAHYRLITPHAEDDAREFYIEGWVVGFFDVWHRVCAKLSRLKA